MCPGGFFTTHVFEKLKEKDILRFEGPLGGFRLDKDSQRPIVLLAGGTGFAPIKSIVENAIATGIQRPMTLYWGSRNLAGLYQFDVARSWEDACLASVSCRCSPTARRRTAGAVALVSPTPP